MGIKSKNNNFFMIDHDFYLMHILLSKSTYYVLLQDMHTFCMFKDANGNNIVNINRFVNKILPIMIKYKKRKDEHFVKIISKKYSNFLKYNDEDAISFLLYLANDNYFSDDNINYHNERISLRISKANMELMDPILEDLEEYNVKKSKFLRSLLNQYSDLKLDVREFICFNKEYNLLEKAIQKKSMIKYYINNICEEAMPILICTCPYNSEIYLFTIKIIKDNKLELKAIRLCEIENISFIDGALDLFNEKINLIINDYILKINYFENSVFIIDIN